MTAIRPIRSDLQSTVAERISYAVTSSANRPALICEAGTLGFDQLGQDADRWRDLLTQHTGTVAFAVELTPASVSAVIGAILARRPFVMIEPNNPGERISHILEVARVELVIADRDRRAAMAALHHTVQSLDATIDPPRAPRSGDGAVTGAHEAGGVVNYQFTSGSTGTPKAVLHSDAMWLGDALFLQERFGFRPDTRVASTMPISFGAGMNVLLAAMMTGATLLSYDPRRHGTQDLLPWLAEQSAAVMVTTPSLLRSIQGGADATPLPLLERLITTGEPVAGKDARIARAGFAREAVFTNWVGSSETGGIAHCDFAPGKVIPDGPLPAGRPGPEKHVTVGDDGTVTVRSARLSAGYLDSEATAAAFTAHPDNTRSFTTGDRGRWDDEYGLVLLGRADDAVKIRGYLVEPAEIHTALTAIRGVAEAHVLVSDRHSATPVLTAFVVPDGLVRTPSPAQLRHQLADSLPPWMLPTHLVTLPELPRTERGKVDPTALTPPERIITELPHPGIESDLAAIWCRALHLDEIGRTENFHELGGDSLAVQEILAAVTKEFQITFTTADLAAAPSIAEFAVRLDAAHGQRRRAARISAGSAQRRPATRSSGAPPSAAAPALASTTVALRPITAASTQVPLWCFAGAGASALTFLPLASHQPPTQPVYAFQPFGLEERGIPDWTVARAARRHLRDLRRLAPSGPHILIGHSLGGFIAIQTARMLAAAGQQVSLVVVLDSFLPPAVSRHRSGDEHTTPEMPPAPGETPLSARELWLRRLSLPLAGIIQRDPVAQTGALEEVGRRVGLLHRPQPWDGPAVVYQSRSNNDAIEDWKTILTGPTEFRRAHCDHASIVREPHIATILAELDLARRTTDATPSSSPTEYR